MLAQRVKTAALIEYRLIMSVICTLYSVLCFPFSAMADDGNANLLKNSSFEQHKEQSAGVFGNYSDFDDWNRSGGFCTHAETNDVYDGAASLKLGAATASSVYQQITGLTNAYYADNSLFRLTLHYKALTVRNGGSIALDAYWEHSTVSDGLKSHDAAQLQRVLSDTVQSEWQTLVIETTRPANAKSFMLQFKASANCFMLIDSLSFEAVPQSTEEPFITIAPKTLYSVSCELGQSVAFPTIHITQGNLQGPTTFELSYTDADQFRLSRETLAANESEGDLTITYAPTKAGTHKAILNIDNSNHTTLFQSITLSASCIDPNVKPTITVLPAVIPAFETVAGKQVSGKFTVRSENCTDFVHLRVNHVQGHAFTISESTLAKNYEAEVTVYFAPIEEGTYLSKVTLTSENADTVLVTLNGTAAAKSAENIDWLVDFQWDESQPLPLMNENFNAVRHNETLVLDGWQNVAALDGRPWWGFDETSTTPIRGSEKYAKATTYRYGKSSTGEKEMWLVTPALDYKNAESKIFAFSVMGENMPEENIEARFEVYYVDATGNRAFFQDLTESFNIPHTGDENNQWVTFQLDLKPYEETMAEVFHIAFRYLGPDGDDGAVVYYVDNVSWGRTDLPQITVLPTMLMDSTATVGKKKIIGSFSVSTRNLTDTISLALSGANYNRFSLSSNTLPKEGGSVSVSFESEEEGVYVAAITISSNGAPDLYVPLTVLCRAPEGFENTKETNTCSKIIRRDGLFIIRGGKTYTLQGQEVN